MRRDPHLTELARKMRNLPSEAEKLLWSRLRAHRLDGRKFRRQYAMGGYIVDFVCLGSQIIIEVDGDSHGEDGAEARDQARTAWLQRQGFRVLRFWNYDVLTNIDGVIETIYDDLNRDALPA